MLTSMTKYLMNRKQPHAKTNKTHNKLLYLAHWLYYNSMVLLHCQRNHHFNKEIIIQERNWLAHKYFALIEKLSLQTAFCIKSRMLQQYAMLYLTEGSRKTGECICNSLLQQWANWVSFRCSKESRIKGSEMQNTKEKRNWHKHCHKTATLKPLGLILFPNNNCQYCMHFILKHCTHYFPVKNTMSFNLIFRNVP